MDATPQTVPPPAYAIAALPDPYRVLGLRLRPFSLGHYLLMQRFGCNYLADDPAAATREDLLLGVLICSMRHDEFLAFIEQPNFQKECRAWGKKVSLFDFPEKDALFSAYLKASLTEPDYIELNPSEGAGDWAQNLKMCLTTRLHHSEAEALDMPLSKALADYYKLAESEGSLRLITDEDRRMAEANDAALQKLSTLSTLNSQPGKGEQWPA